MFRNSRNLAFVPVRCLAQMLVVKGCAETGIIIKYKKIIISLFMVFTLIITALAGFGTAKTSASAILNSMYYTLGTQESGIITENGEDKQYYMFTLPSSGSVEITGSAYMEYIDLYMYDENADELWHTDEWWNSTSEVISIKHTLYLTSGDYYFCIGKMNSCSGGFNFNINFTSIDESFIEVTGGSNNTTATASNVNTDGTLYNAQIALNDDKDFFKFVLYESGKVNFNALFYKMRMVEWKLYDEEGIELLSRNQEYNYTTEDISITEDLYLVSGTYYIVISKYNDYREYEGKYNFSLLFSPSEETYIETNGGSNNSISSASSLILENDYKGQIALNDDKDFYVFNLSSSQAVSISVQAGIKNAYIRLYGFNGNELDSWSPGWNDVTKEINFRETKVLKRGDYYIAVVADYGSCGNYILNISPLTESNCPHEEFDSKWHAPSYFTIGYMEYICEKCGYSYKGDYEPVKNLRQGYLYSYSYAGKRSLNLYWATVTDASGYQIRYGTRKNLKSNSVVKKIKGQTADRITIKKLKKNKNYYIQTRAYKTSGSKTVYGKWSVKIKLKTK